MSVTILSSVLNGFDGNQVKVECILSNNLPNITIVGMGNKAIDEAKERVRGAITHSGLDIPRKRIVVNLAPAEMPKSGSSLDLSIAIAILAASGQIDKNRVTDVSFVGELALDGRIRPVVGILGHIRQAEASGLNTIFIPKDSAAQASLGGRVKIIPVSSLKELYGYIHDDIQIEPLSHLDFGSCKSSEYTRLEDIRGQAAAKRALAIAVSGRHNLLLSGPPGTGKTMLASAAVGLMPQLNREEIATLTHLYSISTGTQKVITCRPVRSPHHTASHISLIGGGTTPKPGEISLAHNGILFLDEILEFSRHTLETLRQPLENKYVNITRASSVATYPADFTLIGALNPCPCGFLGDKRHNCVCSEQVIHSYQRKLSGPMLDRFDLQITLDRINYTDTPSADYSTQDLANKVATAWQKQKARNTGSVFNSQLQLKELESTVLSDLTLRDFYIEAADKLALSTRVFVKMLRVARTIADLDGDELVEKKHILEALTYRKTLQTANSSL